MSGFGCGYAGFMEHATNMDVDFDAIADFDLLPVNCTPLALSECIKHLMPSHAFNELSHKYVNNNCVSVCVWMLMRNHNLCF